MRLWPSETICQFGFTLFSALFLLPAERSAQATILSTVKLVYPAAKGIDANTKILRQVTGDEIVRLLEAQGVVKLKVEGSEGLGEPPRAVQFSEKAAYELDSCMSNVWEGNILLTPTRQS